MRDLDLYLRDDYHLLIFVEDSHTFYGIWTSSHAIDQWKDFLISVKDSHIIYEIRLQSHTIGH